MYLSYGSTRIQLKSLFVILMSVFEQHYFHQVFCLAKKNSKTYLILECRDELSTPKKERNQLIITTGNTATIGCQVP